MALIPNGIYLLFIHFEILEEIYSGKVSQLSIFVFTAKIKQGANIVLILLMMVAVYSHYMVNDKFERIAPALVGSCCCYMLLSLFGVFQVESH